MRQSVATTKHRRTTDEIIVQAKNFLDQYYTSIKRVNSPAHIERWNQVKSSIIKHGTYQLKETELIYGAKLAWRNASRCIGRIQWSKLQVRIQFSHSDSPNLPKPFSNFTFFPTKNCF